MMVPDFTVKSYWQALRCYTGLCRVVSRIFTLMVLLSLGRLCRGRVR